MRLRDKVAIITGAGSGQGRAAALVFAKEGAKIVVADANPDGGKETVEMIRRACGEAVFVRADVSEEEQVRNMTRTTKEKYGKLNILYSNAGIEGAIKKVDVLDGNEWDRVLNVNLKGAFLGAKHAIPEMVEQGGGSIINTASIWGVFAAFYGLHSGYTASKGGIIGLTKELAIEWAPHRIRVNCICPGSIDTPMNATMTKEQVEENIKRIPLGRFGRPEEVAFVALFLASDESSFCTGSVFTVDGGESAH